MKIPAKALILYLALILSGTFTGVHAQESVKQKDLSDVFAGRKKRAKQATESDSIVVKKIYLSLLPIIGYGPANGFIIGGSAAASSLLGDPATTHLSNVASNLNITSKGQVYLNVRSNIYAPNDAIILQGDWRIMFFNQPTYGLGIELPGGEDNLSLNGVNLQLRPNEQPMDFNYLRIYETMYKPITKRFYAGVGFHLDRHWKIDDNLLDTLADEPVLTSHYLYSRLKEFNIEKYSTNGASASLLYDSRDNAINAYKGLYAQLSVRRNVEFLGSDQESATLFYDFRTYLNLEKKHPGRILAFWSWAQFQFNGNMPYLALPSIGWDMYNRSARGYIQGRFRGEDMFYAETEYRRPISRSGLFGAVAFLNVTSASNEYLQQSLMDDFAFGYGIGVRIKMKKETRTNLTIDFGRGEGGSSAVYFNLMEYF